MITSRPKKSALYSIIIFILVCFSIGFYSFRPILDGQGWWLNYVLFFMLVPLGILLSIRQLLAYKTISFKGNEVILNYPVRRSSRSYDLREMQSWEETVIKTANGQFEQIEMTFEGKGVSLSDQENSNYKQIQALLMKKGKSKKKK